MSTEQKIDPSRRGKGTTADEWTDEINPPAAEPEEDIQKTSLMLPISVHTALKSGAANRRKTMLAVVVEMIRARWMGGRWPEDVVEQVQAQVQADQAAKPAAQKRQAG